MAKERAFPSSGTSEMGMTLRDYFAGQALAGRLACEDLSYTIAADEAYRYADAMIERRKKDQVPHD